jgi:hypothetical protein
MQDRNVYEKSKYNLRGDKQFEEHQFKKSISR